MGIWVSVGTITGGSCIGGGFLLYGGGFLARVGGGILRVAGLIPAPLGGALRHQFVLGGSDGVSPEGGLLYGVSDV